MTFGRGQRRNNNYIISNYQNYVSFKTVHSYNICSSVYYMGIYRVIKKEKSIFLKVTAQVIVTKKFIRTLNSEL
jgi:hypothetical protein